MPALSYATKPGERPLVTMGTLPVYKQKPLVLIRVVVRYKVV